MFKYSRSMNLSLSILAKKLIKVSSFIQLLLFLIFIYATTDAQESPADAKRPKRSSDNREIDLFGSTDILNVTISLDLGAYLKKTSRDETFDSEMTIHFSPTDSLYSKTIIRYRGISRYNICTFPPIQINFKKPVYSDSFKIKKLKLVTHCQANNVNDEYVVREYLVYKLYNALTDTSFRVRLLHVKYIDSKDKKKPVVKYGIFIEPGEMVAKRTKSTVVNTLTLNQSNIIPYSMDRLAIFNYMVTNWDWSIPGEHNVEVIKPMAYNPNGLGIAIPHDFDLTGVVNADYAIPPPDLGIENVRQPIFTGICRTREVYREDLLRFLASREKLYSVVNEFPHLNQRAKKDIITFLDQFFNQMEKEKNFNNLIDKFLKSCKIY